MKHKKLLLKDEKTELYYIFCDNILYLLSDNFEFINKVYEQLTFEQPKFTVLKSEEC